MKLSRSLALFRQMLSEATGSYRLKAEVHGVIYPHLIEYSVIPASPQSAAAAGLTAFSDIRNCLGRLWGRHGRRFEPA